VTDQYDAIAPWYLKDDPNFVWVPTTKNTVLTVPHSVTYNTGTGFIFNYGRIQLTSANGTRYTVISKVHRDHYVNVLWYLDENNKVIQGSNFEVLTCLIPATTHEPIDASTSGPTSSSAATTNGETSTLAVTEPPTTTLISINGPTTDASTTITNPQISTPTSPTIVISTSEPTAASTAEPITSSATEPPPTTIVITTEASTGLTTENLTEAPTTTDAPTTSKRLNQFKIIFIIFL
jgi:hypothetical protein